MVLDFGCRRDLVLECGSAGRTDVVVRGVAVLVPTILKEVVEDPALPGTLPQRRMLLALLLKYVGPDAESTWKYDKWQTEKPNGHEDRNA